VSATSATTPTEILQINAELVFRAIPLTAIVRVSLNNKANSKAHRKANSNTSNNINTNTNTDTNSSRLNLFAHPSVNAKDLSRTRAPAAWIPTPIQQPTAPNVSTATFRFMLAQLALLTQPPPPPYQLA